MKWAQQNKLRKICTIKIVFLSLSHNLKAIHNKDYSVVKTSSASTIFGAFLFPIFTFNKLLLVYQGSY